MKMIYLAKVFREVGKTPSFWTSLLFYTLINTVVHDPSKIGVDKREKCWRRHVWPLYPLHFSAFTEVLQDLSLWTPQDPAESQRVATCPWDSKGLLWRYAPLSRPALGCWDQRLWRSVLCVRPTTTNPHASTLETGILVLRLLMMYVSL